MSEHTEGPWHKDGWEIHSDRGKVAESYCPHRFSLEEHKANGRLIAAAPELLEACRGLVEMVEDYKLARGGIVNEAKVAIAKAEGDSTA